MPDTCPEPKSALSGLKVLDLSRVLAGPWCSQTLADLGADVIKIERPGKGDDTRGWGPPYISDDLGQPVESAYFLSANRGKRSLALDISQSKGQQLVQLLAVNADVVIENFKVGGLRKYNLDYQSLKPLNPAMIYCSVTGFGQDGPAAHHPGYDFMIQGMGGLMHITGQPEGEPVKVGVAVADIMTGMYATVAILAALNHRNASGKGQYIDMALLDSQVAMLANQASNFLVSGESPERLGNAHPNIVPYQVLQTLDSFIIVAVGNDSQFERLCDLLGLPGLAEDENYSTNRSRVQNRDDLTRMIEPVIATNTSAYWLDALEGKKIPCGPINNIEQVFNHPQVIHRQMKVKQPHPAVGEVSLVGNPIKMSETPVHYCSHPPMLGEHTFEALQDWLDLETHELDRLVQSGIIEQR